MQNGRKGKGQFHNRPNIALRLAAVLLMLVCISIWLMEGLFAKYRTSDEGSDSARVMTFGNITLTETGDFGTGGGTAYLIPGVDLKKDVLVEFTGSESATYVFVQVELPAHWSTTDTRTFFACNNCIQWTVADEWTFVSTQAEASSPYIFYRELAPNEKLNMRFIAGISKDAPSGVIKVDSKLTKKTLTTLAGLDTPLTINLRAYVVQSNGFDSPLEAWNSIASKSN